MFSCESTQVKNSKTHKVLLSFWNRTEGFTYTQIDWYKGDFFPERIQQKKLLNFMYEERN